MDERQWFHAIQKGNKKYLQDIAEKYYDDIFRFCAFQTGSREDAYDLAQETFLRFIRYVEGYHDRNLKGYLLTIAMNVCRNWLRQKGKEAAVTLRYEEGWIPRAVTDTGGSTGYGQAKDRGESEYSNRDCLKKENAIDIGRIDKHQEQWGHNGPERHVVEADIHNRLMLALGQLPEMQREAILLHYVYDMKYREIGRVTGVSVSTVKSRVRQGMEKLQGILRREDFLD